MVPGHHIIVTCCSALMEANLRRRLRSITHSDLVSPRTKTYCFGLCSFRSSSPSAWNLLPITIRDINLSKEQIKKFLKQFLFSIVYVVV